MKHDEICKVVHRSEDGWRAHMPAAIEAARRTIAVFLGHPEH
jgi:hypothetical protein